MDYETSLLPKMIPVHCSKCLNAYNKTITQNDVLNIINYSYFVVVFVAVVLLFFCFSKKKELIK